MKTLIALFSILLTAGCMHCGPECQESRKSKQAFLTDDCKVTWNTRECKKKEMGAPEATPAVEKTP